MDAAKESGIRNKLHEIIYEADTPMGKWVDIILLWAILLSIAAVILESVDEIGTKYRTLLHVLEWIFTILFTIEYALRIWVVQKPWKYIFSFYGLVDLLAILPTYLSLIFTGGQFLMAIRILRLLRIFRIFKLVRFIKESRVLAAALRASRHKIAVFLGTVLVSVVIMGTVMYMIEGPEHGFTSIPRGIYWAIVTLTTVGFGDIYPQTVFGQFVASFIMIMGYAIIAVPTGIVTSELARQKPVQLNTQVCPSCAHAKHDDDAVHCKKCGAELNPETVDG
ncbi:MAG: ion transporter [Bacteroidia bacterium]|nr:ion transporter [Bacteroidia bacterium]